jgi:anti-anti-sigma regulatory factor
MYILNWNPTEQQMEASFGGAVTRGEAEVFLDEFRDLLKADDIADFELVVDFAKVSRMDDDVANVFESAREVAKFSGAKLVTFVTRNDDEVVDLTSGRLQQVLEGCERYVAYHIAA